MLVINSFEYLLKDGKMGLQATDRLTESEDLEQAKELKDSLKELGYQEVNLGKLQMFMKYNDVSVSLRSLLVVTFEELETEKDIFDMTLDELFEETGLNKAIEELVDEIYK